LFRGRRQRGTAPAPPLEFAIHCVIADFVRRWLHPSWRATHLPFGEHRSPATAARLKRMGVTPGWPDWMFVGPGRTVFWLELKRAKTGRVTGPQAEMATHLVACGFGYLCTSSVDDAIAALKDAGILRASFEVQ
jgi:hypothetical protein